MHQGIYQLITRVKLVITKASKRLGFITSYIRGNNLYQGVIFVYYFICYSKGFTSLLQWINLLLQEVY